MISIQTRRISLRYLNSRDDENDASPWVEVDGYFEWTPSARAATMRVMQEVGFNPYADVCLLVDELRPGFTDDPFTNILTEDNGMQIRVIPVEG